MRSVSVALALLLAAGAVSAAETASQRTKKQRKAPAGQELAAPAGLEQPSALLTRTRAVQQPFAARTLVEPARADTVTTGWISVTDREGTPVTRDLEKGARRAGILPIVLPPFIPPASPIR